MAVATPLFVVLACCCCLSVFQATVWHQRWGQRFLMLSAIVLTCASAEELFGCCCLQISLVPFLVLAALRLNGTSLPLWAVLAPLYPIELVLLCGSLVWMVEPLHSEDWKRRAAVLSQLALLATQLMACLQDARVIRLRPAIVFAPLCAVLLPLALWGCERGVQGTAHLCSNLWSRWRERRTILQQRRDVLAALGFEDEESESEWRTHGSSNSAAKTKRR